VADELEQRVSLLEAARTVDDARLNEIESWRRRDEPRTLALVNDATVADQVRKALRERSTRSWSLWQKAGATLLGGIAFAGSTVSLLQAIHVL
jgi:hypothetical protein